VVRPASATARALCEACNLAKDAVGWRARARADGSVETVTPTGHTYVSHLPPSPVARAPSESWRADFIFRDFVLTA
jgi:hypothetical protein